MPPKSFLDLPREIRLLIYSYLRPNIQIERYHTGRRGKWPQMRGDGCQECAPAMLQTNSTIYQELVQEWYGAVPYSIRIDSNGIEFTGWERFEPYKPLPSVLRFIKTMNFSILMTLPREESKQTPKKNYQTGHEWAHPKGFLDLLDELIELLCRDGGSLRRLNVTVSMEISTWFKVSGEPELIRPMIELNLRSIREKVRGPIETHFEFDLPQKRPLNLVNESGEKHARTCSIGREMLGSIQAEIKERNARCIC